MNVTPKLSIAAPNEIVGRRDSSPDPDGRQ
jgi:hypothetical protein